MKFARTIFVTEDGEMFYKNEVEKYHYKTIETITEKHYDKKFNNTTVTTTKRIRIMGRKATQGVLF